MTIDDIVAAWRAHEESDPLQPPASEEQVLGAESAMGLEIPEPLRSLYRLANGGQPVGGNIMLDSLEGEFSLVANRKEYLGIEEPFPEEVLVFGGDGAESQYAVWLPTETVGPFSHPVIEIVEHSNSLMGVAGTSLVPFLRALTAWRLLQDLLEPAEDLSTEETARIRHSLGILGVPHRLEEGYSGEHEDLVEAVRWADPYLPSPGRDPCEDPMDAEAIRRVVMGA